MAIKRDTDCPKGVILMDEYSDEWKKRMIDWCTFYRRNVHIFIQHYFGIQLYPYQKLWIYYMDKCDYFISIASRASAKSWLIGLYACAYAVLYPHAEIVVFSETQKMAAIIMGKIEGLRAECEPLYNEIDTLSNNSNVRMCVFKNTSTIKVVACKESGRGNRANLIIGEEFALVNKENYDSIIKPFKITRQTAFSMLPEWANFKKEEPKEILISSARHKGLWWYSETVKLIKDMILGKNVGFIAFDYLLSIYHGIKTVPMIEQEKSTMDLITFQEEYCNIPFGENSDAYFKLAMFDRCRKINKAFYPQRRDTYNAKKNPYDIKKVDGELRILSVDIASRANSVNDNTIISCMRLLPTSEGYIREVCYMESHLGENTFVQAFRIKQLFYDFLGDYVVIDVQSSGIGVYDDLGLVTKDDERGIEYPAWTTLYSQDMNDKTYKELYDRTIVKNAEEIIYPVAATSQLNNDIAVDFRTKLQKKMISFLVNEMDAEDYFLNKKNKDKANDEAILNYLKVGEEGSEKAWLLHPYIQTSALVNECVALSLTMVNGLVKLKEPNGARKDRYTSVSYGNYFVSIFLDPRIRKEDSFENIDDIVQNAFW